jgi:hypothetical protein
MTWFVKNSLDRGTAFPIAVGRDIVMNEELLLFFFFIFEQDEQELCRLSDT